MLYQACTFEGDIKVQNFLLISLFVIVRERGHLNRSNSNRYRSLDCNTVCYSIGLFDRIGCWHSWLVDLHILQADSDDELAQGSRKFTKNIIYTCLFYFFGKLLTTQQHKIEFEVCASWPRSNTVCKDHDWKLVPDSILHQSLENLFFLLSRINYSQSDFWFS